MASYYYELAGGNCAPCMDQGRHRWLAHYEMEHQHIIPQWPNQRTALKNALTIARGMELDHAALDAWNPDDIENRLLTCFGHNAPLDTSIDVIRQIHSKASVSGLAVKGSDLELILRSEWINRISQLLSWRNDNPNNLNRHFARSDWEHIIALHRVLWGDLGKDPRNVFNRRLAMLGSASDDSEIKNSFSWFLRSAGEKDFLTANLFLSLYLFISRGVPRHWKTTLPNRRNLRAYWSLVHYREVLKTDRLRRIQDIVGPGLWSPVRAFADSGSSVVHFHEIRTALELAVRETHVFLRNSFFIENAIDAFLLWTTNTKWASGLVWKPSGRKDRHHLKLLQSAFLDGIRHFGRVFFGARVAQREKSLDLSTPEGLPAVRRGLGQFQKKQRMLMELRIIKEIWRFVAFGWIWRFSFDRYLAAACSINRAAESLLQSQYFDENNGIIKTVAEIDFNRNAFIEKIKRAQDLVNQHLDRMFPGGFK